MKKHLIIFSHHYVDDFVTWNFNNVKNLNPDWDILPIGFLDHKTQLLSNSIYVDPTIYPSNFDIQYHVPHNNIHWFECDLFLYDSYLKNPNYDGYFLYEYDTICNIPIVNFFNIYTDFFGNNICNPGDENWEWIKLYRKHNLYNKSFNKIYSYGQSTCIYMSNDILKKCTEEIIKNKHLYNNMFCEIRGGTLVNQFTLLKPTRNDIKKFISWTKNEIEIDVNTEYFYHPVKSQLLF